MDPTYQKFIRALDAAITEWPEAADAIIQDPAYIDGIRVKLRLTKANKFGDAVTEEFLVSGLDMLMRTDAGLIEMARARCRRAIKAMQEELDSQDAMSEEQYRALRKAS